MTTWRYVLMEWTSCPGRWQPLARCFLQAAERATGMNRRHYHERARPLGELLTYSEHDARRMVDQRRQDAPYARLMLFAVPTINP